MKYTFLFWAVLLFCGRLLAAEGPVPFDKFYKPAMKVTPGLFPVYQDGDKYYMEVPGACLNKDILVMGDVAQGLVNAVATSSGVIRFSKGSRRQLNITRQEYKEAVSPGFNQEMEPLVQLSNLVPVTFVVKIEALGKDTGNYIIDLTRHLTEGGQFFAFRDFAVLTRPDPTRSGVQAVYATKNAVTFSVLRTQTELGNREGKKMDVASAVLLHLSFQLLPLQQMQPREADPRIGFTTVAYNDFGKTPYTVKNIKLIRKWNLQVQPQDSLAYLSGKPVTPAAPITVFIDKATPAVFVPYIQQALAQWNTAFAAAGFTNVFRISKDEQDNRLLYGNILIKWGNVNAKAVTSIVEDPRSGEILAARMNISEQIAENLLPEYFVACALTDERLRQNSNQPQVKGELIEWAVANAMGELLGMEQNLAGSAAYSVSQLRSAAWVQQHGISSSVTDGVVFNYLAQPGDRLPVSSLIARVSAYDSLAIGWAYRIYSSEKEARQALQSLRANNTALRYLRENKNDPNTQYNDLSSEPIQASTLAMKNMAALYPRLESITGAMQGGDEDWQQFRILSEAMIKNYELQIRTALARIGGVSERPLWKGYNDTAVVYLSKKEQQAAFDFLRTYVFTGVPAWMNNKRAAAMGGEAVNDKLLRMALGCMGRLLSIETLSQLVAAQEALGDKAFTPGDLFALLDRTIFNDFNPLVTPDAYHAELQRNLLNVLTQVVSKNPVTAGLNGVNETLHFYYVRTLKNIRRLAATHHNAAMRSRYQLMLNVIEKDYLKKPL